MGQLSGKKELKVNAFTALADNTRRQIVLLLAKKGELPVSEISENFDMSAPAVSQHLKILKKANVVQMKKKAQKRLYCIRESGLSEIENWITIVQMLRNKRAERFDEKLTRKKKKT